MPEILVEVPLFDDREKCIKGLLGVENAADVSDTLATVRLFDDSKG